MNNCGCNCNSIQLPIGPKGNAGTNGKNGLSLLVNDVSPSTTTSTSEEILKLYVIPANTFLNNGDMLHLETFVTVSDPAYVSTTELKLGSLSELISLLGSTSQIGNKLSLKFTKISSNQLAIELEQDSVFPFNALNDKTFRIISTGTFDFTSALSLSLNTIDTVTSNTTISLFRITLFKV